MHRDVAQIDLSHLKSSSEGGMRSSAEILKLVMKATLGNVTTGGVKWIPKEYRFSWTPAIRVSGLKEETTTS